MSETKFIAVIRRRSSNTTYISTQKRGVLYWYTLTINPSEPGSLPTLMEYDSRIEAEATAKRATSGEKSFEVAAAPSQQAIGLLRTPVNAWKGLSLVEVLERVSSGVSICRGIHVEEAP